MRLRVLYFGVLKDIFGRDGEEVELPAGSSVEMLTKMLRERARGGSIAADDLWRSVAVAVNQEYVQGAVVLQDRDEVALLPPVSGGWDEVWG
ncbi:molybdopterin converting factor subunit 1 [Granulicella arctica]|uniref:molybdopterin converting factor subunit 1 n=1 Tax=Granulicella arctica TaxID=940613 RepID=UPI0021E011B6|nr:molybdopterin converting factor subunit 1 [Granulicella arctica]